MKKKTIKDQRVNTNIMKKKAPENKDDLDSRKNEEFDFKGDDVTHNKKETKKNKK